MKKLFFFLSIAMFFSFNTTAHAAPVSIGENYAFGFLDNLGELSSSFMGPVFAIAGTIVFIYFIVGAFRMIISNGDKNIIASAREEMYHGIIGFFLLIILFLLVEYLPRFFGFQGFSLIKLN